MRWRASAPSLCVALGAAVLLAPGPALGQASPQPKPESAPSKIEARADELMKQMSEDFAAADRDKDGQLD